MFTGALNPVQLVNNEFNTFPKSTGAAKEWYEFADMHLRHHFGEKKRIDAFWKTENWLMNWTFLFFFGFLAFPGLGN